MTRQCVWIIAASLAVSACKPEPPVKVELPPPAHALTEEEVRPVEQPQMEIVDLQEDSSADKKQVTLRGTLRNNGTGPTHQLAVRVEARNQADLVLFSVEATPSTEVVAPGESVTFTAVVDNRPDTAGYRVETLAR